MPIDSTSTRSMNISPISSIPSVRPDFRGRTDEAGSPDQRQDPVFRRTDAGPDGHDPTEETEEKELRELQSRDRQVRSHEQAHKAAGGRHAGSPSFSTTTGPDGRQYAVSGEVSIDTSKVPNDPARTIQKMEAVRRAALAPAGPSAQDRRVAQQANTSKLQAQRELEEQRAETQDQAVSAARGASLYGEQASATDLAAVSEADAAKDRARSSAPPGIVFDLFG